MRIGPFSLVLSSLLFAATASAQQHDHMAAAPAPQVTLQPGMGDQHRPVSTTNAEAQKFFDQGLTYVYAFNHEEAVKSFTRAAELDPQLAMAHWGIALALGPNINMDVDPDRENAAYKEIQVARSLERGASENERGLIDTLALRYSNQPGADLKKLSTDYANAMRELSKRYPDDLDIATLFAESMMDLRPWQLWDNSGKPAEGTEEIVATLEGVLKRDPKHIGANHYYVHAVEASSNPTRALPSAERLASLVPAAGHLVHMPAHIYMRTGDYDEAVTANERAVAVDRDYIAKNGSENMYSSMYYNHNLQFLACAAAMEGRYAEARKAAAEMAANASAMAHDLPMVEGQVLLPAMIDIRFKRWNAIDATPDPKLGPQAGALWHFARGMSAAARGNLKSAEAEQKAFATSVAAVAADAPFMLNRATDVLAVAGSLLDAHLAEARGQLDQAVESYRKAASQEDALLYDEPPDWLLPARESLGGALLRAGKFSEAEKVFREDLDRQPRSGRSLFGLIQSLKGQGKNGAAAQVQPQYDRAWQHADAPLTAADL